MKSNKFIYLISTNNTKVYYRYQVGIFSIIIFWYANFY